MKNNPIIQGRWYKINKKVKKRIKMNEKKSLTTEETFALAVQNRQKNNLQVAENLYNETLKTNPNHVDAYYNLGNVFQKLGENQKAKSSY